MTPALFQPPKETAHLRLLDKFGNQQRGIRVKVTECTRPPTGKNVDAERQASLAPEIHRQKHAIDATIGDGLRTIRLAACLTLAAVCIASSEAIEPAGKLQMTGRPGSPQKGGPHIEVGGHLEMTGRDPSPAIAMGRLEVGRRPPSPPIAVAVWK